MELELDDGEARLFRTAGYVHDSSEHVVGFGKGRLGRGCLRLVGRLSRFGIKAEMLEERKEGARFSVNVGRD